ncbi:hypothetical protein ACFLTP_10215 [Chloroflexota bacterium]
MPKCPNCGLPTKRTEDWACQSCGHPLLSESYEKVPKTYEQLRKERLQKQELRFNIDRTQEQKSYLIEDAATTTIELTVEELFTVCTADKDKAATKFCRRILTVSGVVSRIVVNYDYDIYYVSLTNPQKGEACSVNCMFDNKSSSDLNLLTEGQTVTIEGKYDDFELNILMKECALAHSSTREETTTPIKSSNNTLSPTHTQQSVSESATEPEPRPALAPETETESKPEPLAGLEAQMTPEPDPIAKVETQLIHDTELKAELLQTPTAIEVTVDELLSAYVTDVAAADERFGDKILKITGVVDRINKKYLDFDYITLTNTENSLLQHVQCLFDKKHGPELNQLTTGQKVTVQGTYDGSIVNIRLRDCDFFPHPTGRG